MVRDVGAFNLAFAFIFAASAITLHDNLVRLSLIGCQAIADSDVPGQPVRASAHVLLAALDEAALYISRAEDPDQARSQMYAVCDRLIDGITGSDTSGHI